MFHPCYSLIIFILPFSFLLSTSCTQPFLLSPLPFLSSTRLSNLVLTPHHFTNPHSAPSTLSSPPPLPLPSSPGPLLVRLLPLRKSLTPPRGFNPHRILDRHRQQKNRRHDPQPLPSARNRASSPGISRRRAERSVLCLSRWILSGSGESPFRRRRRRRE